MWLDMSSGSMRDVGRGVAYRTVSAQGETRSQVLALGVELGDFQANAEAVIRIIELTDD